MKKDTIEPLDRARDDDPGPANEDCVSAPSLEKFHAAMRILTGKWKGEILWLLFQGKLRFGELRRALPDITQHMLTAQLRDLERNGLISRTIYPEVPPRVEYELTPSARALRPVFTEINRWAAEHAGALDSIEDPAPEGEAPTHTTG